MTVGILAVGVPVAACGGPSTPGVAGSTTTTSTTASSSAHGSTGATALLAYSSCVRSHGVPNFPDPTSNEGIPKETAQQLGVSQSQLQAAQSDCTHLLPAGGTLSGTNNQRSGRAAAVLPQSSFLHALTRRHQLPRTQLLRAAPSTSKGSDISPASTHRCSPMPSTSAESSSPRDSPTAAGQADE